MATTPIPFAFARASAAGLHLVASQTASTADFYRMSSSVPLEEVARALQKTQQLTEHNQLDRFRYLHPMMNHIARLLDILEDEYPVACALIGDGARDLLLGAPTAKVSGVKQAGKVIVYSTKAKANLKVIMKDGKFHKRG